MDAEAPELGVWEVADGAEVPPYESFRSRPRRRSTRVRMAEDGLPVLHVDDVVTNEAVLDTIDHERAEC